jgi:hypothetical protein
MLENIHTNKLVISVQQIVKRGFAGGFFLALLPVHKYPVKLKTPMKSY